MDPNLTKIREENKYLINRGDIKPAIDQAKDYLTYIIGWDNNKIEEELQEFVATLKQMRKEANGKRKKEQRQFNHQ